MKKYYIQNGNCGTEMTFKIIGAKWKPYILNDCYKNSNVSFSTLKQSLTGISDSVLTKQLNELVNDEMLIKDYTGENGKAFYRTTPKTEALLPSLLLIEKFSMACDYPHSGEKSKIEYVKKLIGGKWKSRIIWMIYKNDTIRFNQLLNCIEGLSHKVLIEHLNDLLSNSLIIKTDYNQKLPHVEYSLTEKGKMAYDIVQSLADWCQAYDLLKPKITINY